MSFTDLGLPVSLTDVLAEQQYIHPYPIQKEAIPVILKGKDLLGIAKTGSGKTAGYVLPLLANLQGKEAPENRHVSVLVVVPTRELAIQVKGVFDIFSKSVYGPVKCMAVYGGVSINPQMIGLQGVNILVATPGRLLDLVKSKAVHLSAVKTLVLDEADKMLNLGFRDEMDAIFKLLPAKRQNLLFSATLSKDVKQIKQLLLDEPAVVKIEEEKENLEQINQVAYLVEEERKGPLLRYIIENNDYEQILIFTSSVYKADNVAAKLRKNGFDAVATHGKKSQKARTDALKFFKEGGIHILVTTDLLARGIDIEMLPCVINYELPRSPKDYIHRIGRTGRAGATGDAISFVTEDDRHHFKVIQKKMGRWVTMNDSEGLDYKEY